MTPVPEGTASLKVNAQLKKSVEMQQAGGPCGWCQKQAASTECHMCKSRFCEPCKEESHSRPAWKQHEFGPLGSLAKRRGGYETNCGCHDRPLSYYCSSCSQLVCDVCTKADIHRGHLFPTVSEASKQIPSMPETVDTLREVATELRRLQKLLDESEESVTRDGLESVHECQEAFAAYLRAVEQCIQQRVERIRAQKSALAVLQRRVTRHMSLGMVAAEPAQCVVVHCGTVAALGIAQDLQVALPPLLRLQERDLLAVLPRMPHGQGVTERFQDLANPAARSTPKASPKLEPSNPRATLRVPAAEPAATASPRRASVSDVPTPPKAGLPPRSASLSDTFASGSPASAKGPPRAPAASGGNAGGLQGNAPPAAQPPSSPSRLPLEFQVDTPDLTFSKRNRRCAASARLTDWRLACTTQGFSAGRQQWAVKVSGEGHPSCMIGLVPGGIVKVGTVFKRSGLFLYAANGSLFSGPPTSLADKAYTASIPPGSTVTVYLDFDAQTVAFSVNGQPRGVAFTALPPGPLHPAVSIYGNITVDLV
eukprot:GGOE01044777.1.p1 GENE.GGOE01044777.1~~GGOE01044777.1.p1  ORF type:complete len:610 (+),score=85.30 GGOE01044777.1:218-1831(+)